jgi:hypothetical protein
MAGHRTPTGVFSVIGKERWHRSNIYSGAPMPLMQRITWSGIALHAGVLPGYPASHGCIRLHPSFAQELWGITKIGTRVIVSPRDTGVERASHPKLPLPTLLPAPQTNTASPDGQLVRVAAVANAAAVKLLNPLEWAAAAKAKATVDAAAATKAAKAALESSTAASAQARLSVEELRRAEGDLRTAQAALDAATQKGIDVSKQALLERLQDAQKRADEARAAESLKRREAFSAAETSKQADRLASAAEEAIKDSTRRIEPVSVFISRKEGRLFVRQAYKPVFDVSVTIKDPDLPLGTHVFVATGVGQGAAGLEWSVVSVPNGSGTIDGRSGRSGGGRSGRPEASEGPGREDTAAGALDRIELPADAMRQISERLWVGASLIISDYGVSGETGEYTDFIILTR